MPSERSRFASSGLCMLAVFPMTVLWIMFVGDTRRDEMIVGAGVMLLCGAFLYLLARKETLTLDFRWVDLATGWRIPLYIATDVCDVVIVLMKDLLGVQRADSVYRVCGFKTSKFDPRLIARRVLATAYSTASPNFIVIGIDCRRSRMLFHQLKPSKISRMTKELGAQPGADHP